MQKLGCVGSFFLIFTALFPVSYFGKNGLKPPNALPDIQAQMAHESSPTFYLTQEKTTLKIDGNTTNQLMTLLSLGPVVVPISPLLYHIKTC